MCVCMFMTDQEAEREQHIARSAAVFRKTDKYFVRVGIDDQTCPETNGVWHVTTRADFHWALTERADLAWPISRSNASDIVSCLEHHKIRGIKWIEVVEVIVRVESETT